VIYFIRDDLSGHIKIGVADDPWRRLSKIQSDCPGSVCLLGVEEGGREREAELHGQFAALRCRGEWFRPGPRLREHVAALGEAIRPLGYRRTAAFWNGHIASDVAKAVGVAKSTLSTIQSGKRRASPELALRIQRATGVSALALVFGCDAEEVATGYTPAATAEAA
jgi:transcriptional regulator with XRE-family HTH domain